MSARRGLELAAEALRGELLGLVADAQCDEALAGSPGGLHRCTGSPGGLHAVARTWAPSGPEPQA
eukprot:9189669-Alexandrium_andersonii.AAC.1